MSQIASAVNAFSGSPTNKVVYLTFDDGPNNLYHPQILAILKKYNVKATFFLVGDNMLKYPDVTRQTLADGHVIGDHSLTHAFLPGLAFPAILEEIATTTGILQTFTHKKAVLFRPPYGGVNAEVRKDSRILNLSLTLWDVDPKDWSEPSTDELVRRVVRNVHPGSDVLLHSNHDSTVKALPQIIEQIQAQGYTFQTL